MARRKISKRHLNIFKFLSIILILFFILFTPTVIQKLIKINTISCTSQYDLCPTEINDKIKNLELKDYRLVKKEVKNILSSSNLVNDYSIQYQIPSKLIIELQLNKPKYAVCDNFKNNCYLISEEGVVLVTSDDTNLPNVTRDNINLKIGETILEKDKFALEIVEKVAWLYSVKTGVIDKEELKITLKEGVLVHFPLEGEVDSLVGGLRLIFSRLNDESQGIRMEDIKEIDLRFKNPVLR